MFLRDSLTIGGLVCLLCSVGLYFFTGAASTIGEISFTQKAMPAAVFAGIAVLCFYFAFRQWNNERMDRLQQTTLSELDTRSDTEQ